MTVTGQNRSVFHAGEHFFQRAAKLQGMEEFGRRLLRSYMPDQHRTFFENQEWLYIGAKDAQNQPWATILVGRHGFVKSETPDALSFNDYHKFTADPVEFAVGDMVGILGLELHTRRRNRMNGTVRVVGANKLTVKVDQSYGNCPKYIQVRKLALDEEAFATHSADVHGRPTKRCGHLEEEEIAFIQRADTFFIATTTSNTSPGSVQASTGCDMSHRGGEPGFVRVRPDGSLEWSEYGGNNMFMTLGNLHVNPQAGLLFIDFTTGDTLQLTGTATVSFTDSDQTGGDKAVVFKPTDIFFTQHALPLKSSDVLERSPFNPPVAWSVTAKLKAADAHKDTVDSTTSNLMTDAEASSGSGPSRQLVKCVSVKDETPDIKTFEFVLPTGATDGLPGGTEGSFTYLPGQYATFEFHDIPPALESVSQNTVDDTATSTHTHGHMGIYQPANQNAVNAATSAQSRQYTRTWTISSHPSYSRQNGTFTISVKNAGVVSTYLHENIRPESRVCFRGVGGEFTPELAGQGVKKVLFFAAGIGITPIRAMLHEFVPKGVDCILFYAYRREEDAAFLEEFHVLHQRYSTNLKVVSFISAPNHGIGAEEVAHTAGADVASTNAGLLRCTGRISKVKLELFVPDVSERTVFMCGPLAFQEAVEKMLTEVGFPLMQAFQESFAF